MKPDLARLRGYQGYFFDLDGTVYLGPHLIEGADRAIRALRRQGKKTLFLSNKPIESCRDYAEKLSALGIPATLEEVINSSQVTALTIARMAPRATVYCIGEPPLMDELKAAGLRITDDPLRAEFLLASQDRGFSYAKLNDAMLALRHGARFIATNPDRTCPVAGGEIPDCAGMIGAIEGVTGISPEIVCGKPFRYMLDAALERLRLKVSDCLMIGDRLETDIQMGAETGIDTLLVLSGVTTAAMAADYPFKPTYTMNSLADLAQII
ncbi:MAG: HAD-IIA family hydrolase [Kiritimatiellia bacterium]|nr:HAD-IIA family hydrolase [Lentisphaerota bacterium]